MNNLDYDVDDGNLPQNLPNKPDLTSKFGKRKDSSESTAKAARKPRPKLDFNRLLRGNRGLGYLAICTKKSLKLSGKPGNEAKDLSQIVVYLQEWAKLVFPKMPLIEFLRKVEDICQSRIMKSCVPEIMGRIKEMGENVDLKDFEGVETEVMAKLAADQAEKALDGSREGKSISTKEESNDFDLEAELLLHRRTAEYTDNESEIESENGDLDAEELKDFINDDEKEFDNNDYNNDFEPKKKRLHAIIKDESDSE